MVHALRKASTVVLALLLLAAPIRAGEPTSTAATTSDELLLAAVGIRQEFGLRADVEYVATLMSSSSDVGSDLWGFPLTAQEMQNLNLEARTNFQVTSHEVIDFARSLPDFGGAYFDQRDGGELILQFTQVSESMTAEISQLASTDGPPTRIETVQFSFAELSEAMFATRDALRALAPSVELVSVGIREPENGLVVAVLKSDASTAELQAELAERLGVPLRVMLAQGPLEPGACNYRDQLCTPERGGVWAGTTASGCTMGFHLINGSDAQFVTSGHCSDQPSQSKDWYQPSPSASSKIYLGPQRSQLYPGNSVDMQRIELPNNQKSKYIFGEPGKLVYGRSNPTTGALVYGSLGHSFAVRSGTVYTAWGTYSAEGHDLVGTNVHQLVTGGGDSGSPLYYRGCCDRLYALAVYSAGGSVDRWWARIIDGVVRWPGWDIYN